jgi:hypothetical protein
MTDTIKAPKPDHADSCRHSDCAGECCVREECANQPSEPSYGYRCEGCPVELSREDRLGREWKCTVCGKCWKEGKRSDEEPAKQTAPAPTAKLPGPAVGETVEVGRDWVTVLLGLFLACCGGLWYFDSEEGTCWRRPKPAKQPEAAPSDGMTEREQEAWEIENANVSFCGGAVWRPWAEQSEMAKSKALAARDKAAEIFKRRYDIASAQADEWRTFARSLERQRDQQIEDLRVVGRERDEALAKLDKADERVKRAEQERDEALANVREEHERLVRAGVLLGEARQERDNHAQVRQDQREAMRILRHELTNANEDAGKWAAVAATARADAKRAEQERDAASRLAAELAAEVDKHRFDAKLTAEECERLRLQCNSTSRERDEAYRQIESLQTTLREANASIVDNGVALREERKVGERRQADTIARVVDDLEKARAECDEARRERDSARVDGDEARRVRDGYKDSNESAMRAWGDARAEVDRLTARNAELVAALRSAKRSLGQLPWSGYFGELAGKAWDVAHALLARIDAEASGKQTAVDHVWACKHGANMAAQCTPCSLEVAATANAKGRREAFAEAERLAEHALHDGGLGTLRFRLREKAAGK